MPSSTPVCMDAVKLHQCQQFMIDMLKDRGYSFGVQRYQTSLPLFLKYYNAVRNQPNLAENFRITGTLPARGARKKGKFLVQFLPSASDISFGKKNALALAKVIEEAGFTHVFLVTVAAVTMYASQVLKETCQLEVWDMLTCLSRFHRHYLTPRCRRLTNKEKKDFYQSWRLSQQQMPRMLVSDKLSRYWGFQPGDLIEIYKASHIGYYRDYRVVIQG